MGKLRKSKRRGWPRCPGIVLRGRLFTQAETVLVRLLIRKHKSWGRTRLSQELCHLLNWKQPNGRLKERACRVALRQLQRLGFIELPPPLAQTGGRPPIRTMTRLDVLPMERIVRMPACLDLHIVNSVEDSRLWNSLIAQHHYLSLGTPVGRLLRYLARGDRQLVAAISFTESAWQLAARDSLLVAAGLC